VGTSIKHIHGRLFLSWPEKLREEEWIRRLNGKLTVAAPGYEQGKHHRTGRTACLNNWRGLLRGLTLGIIQAAKVDAGISRKKAAPYFRKTRLFGDYPRRGQQLNTPKGKR